MTRLRWERQAERSTWLGYSGEIAIGMVLARHDGQIVYDAALAVNMKWTSKTHGEVASIKAGKAAVARAWARWQKRAGFPE